MMILVIITPPDQTPGSNGLGTTGFIPGIFTVSEARINAGKITETKLIRTIDMENRNTIQGTMSFLEFVLDSCFLSFDNFICHKLLV